MTTPQPSGQVTNPDCLDGGEGFCCIDHDGTGLWCESCKEYADA